MKYSNSVLVTDDPRHLTTSTKTHKTIAFIGRLSAMQQHFGYLAGIRLIVLKQDISKQMLASLEIELFKNVFELWKNINANFDDIHIKLLYSSATRKRIAKLTKIDVDLLHNVSVKGMGKLLYKDLNPNDILSAIMQDSKSHELVFNNLRFTVLPGVYPSNRFRSSRQLILFTENKYVDRKRVLDVGCAHGTMGLSALKNGAKHCVFLDINKNAVTSTKKSIKINGYDSRATVIKSDGLVALKGDKYVFDVVYFNPPFHLDTPDSDLSYCLKNDTKLEPIISKFWKEILPFINKSTVIFLAFSNKDRKALTLLEDSMKKRSFCHDLVVHLFADTPSDVRIYKVTFNPV